MHSRRRSTALAAVVLTLFMAAVTACSGGRGGGGGGTATTGSDPAKISGDITVLTHKTDLAGDGTPSRYAAHFTHILPDVHRKFERHVDYEGGVQSRMNRQDYGELLMIHAAVPVAAYPQAF